MKYSLTILLILGYAAVAVAEEKPLLIGEQVAGDTYLVPTPSTDSVPAREPTVLAGPPRMPHQLNPGLIDDFVLFMGSDVNSNLGPIANALEPAGKSLAKGRKFMVVLIRNDYGTTREQGEKLLRDMRQAGDDLSGYGKWLGWIDTFGNVVLIGSSIYHGDGIGAMQETSNALLSGIVASTGQTAGVVVGGVIGHVIGGPPGGLLLATAGGVIGSGFASFLHDALVAEAIKNKGDKAALGTYDRASQQNALRRAGELISRIRDSIRRGKWADAEVAAQQARVALVLAGLDARDGDIIDKIVEYSSTLREFEGDIARAREKFPEAFDEDLEFALGAALVARERIERRDYDYALSVIEKGLSRRDRLTTARGREVVEELEGLGRLANARKVLDDYETMVSDAEKFLRKDERGEANRLAHQVNFELSNSSLLTFPDEQTGARAKKILGRAGDILRATIPVIDTPPAPQPQPRREELFVGSWTPAGKSPLGNIRIEVYKGEFGYQMMPDHELSKGLHVRGIYVPVKGTTEMYMKMSAEAKVVVHVRTRIENHVTHNIRDDRLIFHTRVVDERLSGGRVISQKVVNDFTVPLKRRE
ncbi:MAG: hypothetical protein O3C40_03620 [Planctomycetota bacterium]|nr:hypothetical protein [Planctomycetota bacterium]